MPQPRSRIVTGLVHDLPVPCVVKAPDRQGQRGLSLVRTRAELPGAIAAALEAARDRGEIAADADVATAVEMCVGAYYARHLAGDPFDAAWEGRVADATLRAVGAAA